MTHTNHVTAVASNAVSTDDAAGGVSAGRSPRQDGLWTGAVDGSDDSFVRGEHRYPDAHQTPSEQRARLDRDGLKRKLRGAP